MTHDSIIPAAGSIALRERASDTEVLLLKRSPDQKIYPGAWVFPGGKTEPDDYAGCSNDSLIEVAKNTAIRETQEEAGIDLSNANMRPFCCWLTPEGQAKRFRTWFFLAVEIPDTRIQLDKREVVESQWLKIDEAIALCDQGQLFLAPATYVTLIRLAHYLSQDERACSNWDPEVFEPVRIALPDGFVSIYREDAGYNESDSELRNPAHRLISRNGSFEYIRSF